VIHSTIGILLAISLLFISKLANAQDASFQSDELYTDAHEMLAISGTGSVSQWRLDGMNPIIDSPPTWTPDRARLKAGCITMTDSVPMPVPGEIVGEVEMSYTLRYLSPGKTKDENPRLFQLVVVGTNLAGNRVEAGTVDIRPKNFGFTIQKLSDGSITKYTHKRLQLIKINGINNEPLNHVRIELCNSLDLNVGFSKANIFLRRLQ
jgi:hypothetical protein